MPFAGPRLDPHRAAELLDLVVDDVHADAAAGGLRELAGRAEARLQDQLDGLLVGDPLILGEQALLVGLAANRGQIEAAAVVADLDDDFGAFAADLQQHLDRPRACRAAGARAGFSMPCATALRSRCSNGGSIDSSTWRSISLPSPSTTSSACLPVSAHAWRTMRCKRGDVALERHHARLHETVLQVRGYSRLLRQQRVGFVREAVQQLVDARDVVRGLGEGARQLLDRRIPVELERIEAALDLRVVLMAMQDLRLGLGFELAQLLAQPRHRAAELAEMKLDRVQLLGQPRLEDVDLAGAVQAAHRATRRRRARSRRAPRCAARAARRAGPERAQPAAALLGRGRRATAIAAFCSTIVASSVTSASPTDSGSSTVGSSTTSAAARRSAIGALGGTPSTIDSSSWRSASVRSTVGTRSTSPSDGRRAAVLRARLRLSAPPARALQRQAPRMLRAAR